MFIMPAKGKITSGFGMRWHPIYKDRRMHWGIDIGSHADNAIIAAAAGRVRLVVRSKKKEGYGTYLIITHKNGHETLYAHLASISVAVGNQVKQGQRIGVKGTTGASTGVHLHFEIHTGKWNNRWSNAKNPLSYIKESGVREVQTLLSAAGYIITVDGINGPATQSTVKAFQLANKLVVDGIAGKETMAALKKASPKENLVVDGFDGPATIAAEQRYWGTPVDGKKSKVSPMVKKRQAMLGVSVDGREGPVTYKAEQKRYGTPQDGKVSKPSAMIKERQRRLNKGKL